MIMKKLTLILLIGLLSACTSRSIEIIDGCEYIQTINPDASVSLTHKGNCKNPIHKQHFEEIDDEPHGPVLDTFKVNK